MKEKIDDYVSNFWNIEIQLIKFLKIKKEKIKI